jgi:hypothetical protein
MAREMLWFVVWRMTSLGSAWKGGHPLGESITQLSDMLAESIGEWDDGSTIVELRIAWR